MNIYSKKIDDISFMDFGQYLKPRNSEDFKPESFFYSREMAVLETQKLSIGHLTAYKRQNIFHELERHRNTSELVVVLSGSGSMLFAKPGDDPNVGLTAFHFKAGDAFIMLPSTWHGLALPIGCEQVEMLIGFNYGTEDNDIDISRLANNVTIY